MFSHCGCEKGRYLELSNYWWLFTFLWAYLVTESNPPYMSSGARWQCNCSLWEIFWGKERRGDFKAYCQEN